MPVLCDGHCYKTWEKRKNDIRHICAGLTDDHFSGMSASEKSDFMALGHCRCIPFSALMLAVTARNPTSIACLLRQGTNVDQVKDCVGSVFFYDCRTSLSKSELDAFLEEAFKDIDGERHFQNIKNSVSTMTFSHAIESFAFISRWLDDTAMQYAGEGFCDTWAVEMQCLDAFLDFTPTLNCIAADNDLSFLQLQCPCDLFARILANRGIQSFNLLQTLMRLKCRKLCFIKVKSSTPDAFSNIDALSSFILNEPTMYKGSRVLFLEGNFIDSRGMVHTENLITVELAHESSTLNDKDVDWPNIAAKPIAEGRSFCDLSSKFLEIGQYFKWPCLEYIECPISRQLTQKSLVPSSLQILARNAAALNMQRPLQRSLQILKNTENYSKPVLDMIEAFETD